MEFTLALIDSYGTSLKFPIVLFISANLTQGFFCSTTFSFLSFIRRLFLETAMVGSHCNLPRLKLVRGNRKGTEHLREKKIATDSFLGNVRKHSHRPECLETCIHTRTRTSTHTPVLTPGKTNEKHQSYPLMTFALYASMKWRVKQNSELSAGARRPISTHTYNSFDKEGEITLQCVSDRIWSSSSVPK